MRNLARVKGMATVAGFAVLMGCADGNVIHSMNAVSPLPSRETASVTADDLVVTMTQVGFSRSEILDHGPAVRNALATHGGAEVRRDGNVAAVFSIFDNNLYVVSQRGGTYVHSLP